MSIWKLTCTVIISLIAFPCFGAVDWTVLRQTDWQTHFRDVTFADAQHAWAVGDFGVIASTSDGGKTWKAQISGVKKNLRSVTFFDAKTGWVAGDEGTLLYTSDGGAKWQQQKVETNANITKVFFIDPKVGWLTTSSDGKGSVLSTNDGGKTWKLLTTVELPLLDVHFTNKDVGWAVGGRAMGRRGSAGIILKTTDGGKTWTKPNLQVQGAIFTVYAPDNSNCWIFGSRVALKTEDGGESWIPVIAQEEPEAGVELAEFGGEGFGGPPQASSSIQKASFHPEQMIWGIDSSGQLVRLDEQGILVPAQLQTERLTDVAFGSKEVGCAVGEYGTIATTDDGGKSWTVHTKVKADTLMSISSPTKNVIWSVGLRGAAYMSEDAGKTWTPQNIVSDANLYDVAFADQQNGWATSRVIIRRGGLEEGGGVEASGAILKTTDGGKTWIKKIEEIDPISISIVDSKTVFVCGGNGSVFKTIDGGENWEKLNTQVAWELSDIHFFDAQNGYAVGWGGLIIKTTDGGKTWVRQNAYTSYDLNGVHFVSPTKGWIVGNYGIILTTDDGGETWNSQRCYSYANLNDVYFVDANRGWAVGNSGSLFETTDGGKTWKQAPINVPANLNEIKRGADGSILIAGDWGLVLKGSIK